MAGKDIVDYMGKKNFNHLNQINHKDFAEISESQLYNFGYIYLICLFFKKC